MTEGCLDWFAMGVTGGVVAVVVGAVKLGEADNFVIGGNFPKGSFVKDASSIGCGEGDIGGKDPKDNVEGLLKDMVGIPLVIGTFDKVLGCPQEDKVPVVGATVNAELQEGVLDAVEA